MSQAAISSEARRLYEDVVERAMRHALRRLTRAEALEVAHDVACELVKRQMSGAADPADPRSFEGLVFRCVSNRISNMKRSEDRRAAAERVHHDERGRHMPSWAEADAALDHGELTRVVHRAIAQLPDVMREVFLLVRRDGLSYRDAAERLGVGVGTIHTHLARANVRLRDAVQRYQRGSGFAELAPSVDRKES